ncbi:MULTISPECIES: terminase small subunit [unclassified Ruegeria]|uniref:terminase small subunit n=1 Tax=unclassified Ruegeria TaxID=2625375 RepID=UPI0014882017|nr:MULTISPECIES: terminase small subunit [unclassified Ruegeria]NOD33514.1 terminase small subunit [Ruegeria sp. HKCCD7296]NOE40811.1 terminase small subunit [Ruegeria sp. HKCCD7319]
MSSTTDNPALADTTWLDQFDLNPRQRAFVLAYLADPNGKKAAISAGYAEGSAEVTASKLLSNAKVARAIAEGRKQVESKAMLDAEGIVNLWTQIALADPNELTQHIIAPCRYCYGIEHQYQWKTEREFTERKAEVIFSMFHDEKERDVAMSGAIVDPRIPDDAGGYGYRHTDPPNPACPECSGMGTEITRMADTRKLSPAARLLFDGVKETKQGVEIKMQDRAKALENIAKHYGMFAGKVDAEEVSPLDRLVQRMMGAGNAVPVNPSNESN